MNLFLNFHLFFFPFIVLIEIATLLSLLNNLNWGFNKHAGANWILIGIYCVEIKGAPGWEMLLVSVSSHEYFIFVRIGLMLVESYFLFY